MKFQRHGLYAGLIAGALALTACGSDNSGGGGASTSSAPSGSSSSSGGGGGSPSCFAGTLNGAGSSAQGPAVTAWINAYEGLCSGASINYSPQGSGAGRTQFVQKQVPWAGSDAALADPQKSKADTRCAPGKAVDLPMVLTPEAVVFNVSGLTKLNLTPSVAAQIFSGKITKWNDPAIVAVNSGATLPSTTITPVHRSSDSGTTQNFTAFLSAQAKADWPYKVSQSWPLKNGQGGSNSAALVSQVKNTDGAVGYVDNPDAVKNKLTTASFDTGSGPVSISADSVGKAISAATLSNSGGDVKLKINYGLKQAGAYPAILATYEITCTQGLPSDQAKAVKAWLSYLISSDGQSKLAPLGHFPLPADMQSTVQAAVNQLASS